MDLKRILVAVNALESRDAAFDRALVLARSSGAELYVLHAVPTDGPYSFGAAERLQRMADLRKRAEDAGVAVQTVEQHGDPAEIIELHADAREVDLIVMGGDTRRPWSTRSSIAERVIRRTAVPTLVVAGRASDTPTPYRHVLVALDLSPASQDVLDGALALTIGEAGQLTVLHALSGLEAADAVGSRARWLVPEYRTHLLEDARRSLEPVASAVPSNVDTRLAVTTGAAPRAILEHATDRDADLVVVGRSRGFKVLGSTALRVLRKHDRALLVVPSRARRKEHAQRRLAA